MKKILSILFISFFLFGCSEDSETMDNVEKDDKNTFTVNGNLFSNFETEVSAIEREYLISLTNDDSAIFIAVTDTIAGNYDFIQAELDDKDSLVFSSDLLSNSKLSTVSYLTDSKAYLSSNKGSISVAKDSKYRVSAKFDITLYNILNSEDSIVVKNGFFDFTEPIVIKTVAPNEPTFPETTKEEIQNILQGSYYQLKKFTQLQFLLDATYTNQITNRRFDSYNKHTVSPDDNLLNQFWSDIFSSIRFANEVIEFAHRAYKEDEELNAVIAEAKAIRAYAYFNLLNWFGNAPIILEIPKGISETVLSFSNSTEIEEQIISDLTFSVQNLTSSNNSDKVNLNFANVLLSKVYFKQNKYQKTIDTLSKLTIGADNTNVFSLMIADDELVSLYDLFINNSNLDISKNSEVWLLLASSYNSLNQQSKALQYIGKLKMIDDNFDLDKIPEELCNLWLSESNKNGNRFYLLKTLDKAKETLDIEDYQLILPIPINEIDLDLGVDVKQNPGY
ncbi:RagB/SusD family nutrient uptake outer membrane protein [Wenyingzhuangia sp. IMCC45533]